MRKNETNFKSTTLGSGPQVKQAPLLVNLKMDLRYLVIAIFFAVTGGFAVSAQEIDLEAIHRFAIEVLEEVQPLSIRDDLEYCGLIGFDRSGKLTATKARRGKLYGCRITGKPRRFKTIATYHTHGAYTSYADTEVPSVQDLKHDFRQRLDGYIATPGGRIWFNDKERKNSVLLCGPGCIETDVNYRSCEAIAPLHVYTIESLKWRARNVNDPC